MLGNHDYSEYIKKDEAIKRAYEKETVSLEKRFGWNLLMNENRSIHRLNDSIVVVGTETMVFRHSHTKQISRKQCKM